MRAVIYARYSSDRQRHESIEDQVRVCTEYAASHGMEIVGTYTDEAVSGKRSDRAQFQRMIADSSDGGFDAVVVYKLDRFARDRYASALYRHELKLNGVSLISATEPAVDGPEGILFEGMMESFNEYYSVVLAQNTKRGMEGNALKCKHNGVKTFGYRFNGDYYEIDPWEAEGVRMVFDMFPLHSTREIAQKLDELGYTNVNGGKPDWQFVRKIISNEKYKGVYVWGNVRIEDGIPQIVSAEKWEACQHVNKPRPKKGGEDFWLTGKTFCHCGGRMRGDSAKGRYWYYTCSDCNMRVQKGKLEYAVAKALADALTEERCSEIVKRFDEYAHSDEVMENVTSLRNKIKGLEQRKANLLNAIEQGMPYNEVSDRIKAVDSDLEKSNALLERAEHETGLADVASKFLKAVMELRDKPDKMLVRIMVNKVVVFEDFIVVVFNFRGDGPGLEEVQCAISDEIDGWEPVIQHPNGWFGLRMWI